MNYRSKSRFVLPALLCGALSLASPANAATPLGGLTVAVSPAGDSLVAGGDTRTLIVLDPQSLAVKQRIWIETPIVDLAFSKDGATLAVQDTDGTLMLYGTADWKRIVALPKRDRMTVSLAAGLIAAVDGRTEAVFLHAFATGAEKAKLALPKNSRIAAFGFNRDGTRLAVLAGPGNSKTEQKVAYNAIPKDLRGLDRDEFVQKNDGKESILFVFEVASGKTLVEKTLFYSLTDANARLLFHGDDVVVVSYSNLNAKITPGGEVKLFNMQSSYNYGIGVSPDQGLIMSGGLRGFAFTRPDTLSGVKGELAKLPGWPEYFKGFDATADGKTIYGATTAYRVLRFDADGKVLTAAPVK